MEEAANVCCDGSKGRGVERGVVLQESRLYRGLFSTVWVGGGLRRER